MQRFLPAFLAVLLVGAGLVGGLSFLASRDGSSIDATTPSVSGAGPGGLPAGNIVITYSAGADGAALRKLADTLGATDTPAARAAGQALIAKHDAAARGVTLDTGATAAQAATATDPQVAAFVRQHLGRSTR